MGVIASTALAIMVLLPRQLHNLKPSKLSTRSIRNGGARHLIMCSDSSAGPAAKQPSSPKSWLTRSGLRLSRWVIGIVLGMDMLSICTSHRFASLPAPHFNLACSATEDNTQMWQAKKASRPVIYSINGENAIKSTIAISGEA